MDHYEDNNNENDDNNDWFAEAVAAVVKMKTFS
jgi:hypothetical protein